MARKVTPERGRRWVAVAALALLALTVSLLLLAVSSPPSHPGLAGPTRALPSAGESPSVGPSADCNWDPLSWGGCVGSALSSAWNWVVGGISGALNSAGQQIANAVEAVVVWMVGEALGLLDDLIGGVIALSATVIQATIQAIAGAAESVGPLAIPVFVVGMVALTTGVTVALDTMHDVPVVGAFT